MGAGLGPGDGLTPGEGVRLAAAEGLAGGDPLASGVGLAWDVALAWGCGPADQHGIAGDGEADGWTPPRTMASTMGGETTITV